MCGIFGQHAFASEQPIDESVVRERTQLLQHRGPDDEGFHFEPGLGFGFRRLSIIDLEGGHQPISDESGKVWVICNGEIYNHPELRVELEGKGYRFKTRADVEVIAHGYREWGKDVLGKLEGMFGLAIWDSEARRLIVARDRMGIKLLYYRVDDGVLTFASEMRSLLGLASVGESLDVTSLQLFLQYRFTPSPRTLLAGVRKIPSGGALVCENGEFHTERWYRFRPSAPKQIPAEQAMGELEEIYRAAVRRHLISDVPVGLLLSGGLDSGLLLSLMQEYGKAWPTFSVGYGESFAHDEVEYAKETAAHFGSPNAAVRLDQAEFEASLPKIVRCLEEPVATASVGAMYHVSGRARQDVKVALAGQGPDELFGGYRRHLGVRYGHLLRGLPRPVQRMLAATSHRLPRNEALKRATRSLGSTDRFERYQAVLSLVPPQRIAGLLRAGVKNGDTATAMLECWGPLMERIDATDELGGLNYIEVRSTHPDELLMYSDKLSMAWGLELRIPYADREVVEYAETLPASLKINGTKQKWIHRELCRRHLPASFIRRKKRGFASDVVDGWYRDSTVGKLGYLTDPQSMLFDYLEFAKIQTIVDDHRSGREDYHKILFSLLGLEEWLRWMRSMELL